MKEEHCRLVGITWDGGQGGSLGLAKGLDVVAGERSVLRKKKTQSGLTSWIVVPISRMTDYWRKKGV